MDRVLNVILLVVCLLIGTVVMSFAFSNERPRHNREYYTQKLDEKDTSSK